MVEKLLYDKYNIIAKAIEKTNVGAGSDTYFIDTTTGKYVMKFPCASSINHPLNEPDLCRYLLDRNIDVCCFIRNIDNEFFSYDENGRLFHLQKFIRGKTYDWNTAPEWLLKESAENLGKIHFALKDYNGLPEGIGADFFKFMTPKTALASYKNSLYVAEQEGDPSIISDLEYRIDLMQKFPDCNIDVSKLTCRIYRTPAKTP